MTDEVSPGNPDLDVYYRQETLWNPQRFLADPNERLRARIIAAMIDPETDSVLDVGCGNGFVTQHIRARRVVGLDPSPEAIAHFAGDAVLGSISSLPFSDHEFDTVVYAEVLEHLRDDVYRTAVSELARVARTHLLIGVPFAEELRKGMVRCAQCGSIHHMYLHCRAFRTPRDLLRDFPTFGIAAQAYIGNARRIRSRLFRALRYRWFGARATSPFARCPLCGCNRQVGKPLGFLPTLMAKALDPLAWRMKRDPCPTWMLVLLSRLPVTPKRLHSSTRPPSVREDRPTG